MSEEKEGLIRGSVRAFKDSIFVEEREVQQINITYENLKAVLHVTSIPKDLQAIFDQVHIDWTPNTRMGCRLKTEIKGLKFDELSPADEDYIRIKFKGLTEFAVRKDLGDAIKWLDKHKIAHGEKDGKVACIFKCLTSEQLEVGEF